MAKEQIGASINIEYKSVGEMRKAIKEATSEVVKLQAQFGETSKEALAAAKKVAMIKDQLQEANETVGLFDPGNKFKAFGNAIQGAAGGFAALQGAMGLFGVQSKEIEAQLLKVQSALALSQGLSTIADAGKDFGRLASIIKSQVVTAFSTLRNAIISTGIGALAVGLGLVIANLDKIKSLLNIGVNPETKKFAEATKEAADASRESLKAFDLEERRLRALGVAESEIIAKKKERIRVTLQALDIELKAQEKVLQETLDNFVSSEVQKTGAFGIGGQIWSYLFGTDVKDVKGAQDAVNEIKRQREELSVQLLELDKKEKENADKGNKDANKQAEIDRKNREQKERDAIVEKWKRLTEDQMFQKKVRQDVFDFNNKLDDEQSKKDEDRRFLDSERYRKWLEDRDKQRQEDLKNEQAATELKIQLAQSVGGALGELANLVGRQTAAGKALAIAEIAIGTGVGFINALDIAQKSAKGTGPAAAFAFPIFYATQIAAVLGAASRAKAILSATKGGAGGGTASAPSINTGAPLQPALSPSAQSQALNANAINNLGNTAFRAYILNADLQNQQQINEYLKRGSTI